MEGLDSYREEIDNIDKELTKLFEKRMNVVLKVAQYKKDNNLSVLQQGREDEVLRKAISNLENKDYSNELVKFLESTMEISRDLQKRKITGEDKLEEIHFIRENINKKSRVGFPGVAGAFTEEALIKFFGDDSEKIQYE